MIKESEKREKVQNPQRIEKPGQINKQYKKINRTSHWERFALGVSYSALRHADEKSTSETLNMVSSSSAGGASVFS